MGSSSVVDDAFPSKVSEGAIENSTLTGPILSNSSLVDMSPDSGEGTGNVQLILTFLIKSKEFIFT